MKIGLLSTVDTNIGDDFIRIGIQFLLKQLCLANPEYIIVNKHRPLNAILPDILPRSNMMSKVHYSAGRILGELLGRNLKSLFDGCDLIIQCGTPILWNGCSKSEWAGFIWRGVFPRLAGRVPILNLAGGSCYSWMNNESVQLCSDDKEFAELMVNIADLTTVRDSLAHKIFLNIGSEVDLYPCTAFLAPLSFQNELYEAAKGISSIDVVFNFMSGAGHFDFDHLSIHDEWEKCFIESYNIIKQKKYRTAFICHDDKELVLAKKIDPCVPALRFKNPLDYFVAMANVKGALVNRLHAAVALGGLGIPTVSLGSDTRILMVRQLGMPCHWVGSLPSAKSLVDELENLMLGDERARLIDLKHSLKKSYIEIMKPFFQ